MNRYFFAITGLLATTLGLSALSERRISEPLKIPLNGLPATLAGWTADHDETIPEGTLQKLDATSYLLRVYKKDKEDLQLFVAFYAQQRAGESMHSPKHCLPGAGWEIWNQDSTTLSVNDQIVRINKYSIQNVGVRMLMFYWYQSADRIIANEYLGKVLLARDTLFTGRTAGSIVRIMLPDNDGATDRGVQFAKAIIPEVRRCFLGSQVEAPRQGLN